MIEAPRWIHPFQALESLDRLLEHPDDTQETSRTIAALTGNSRSRLYRRFRRSQAGAGLLRDKPRLREALRDVQQLQSLPEDTLGHALGRFFIEAQPSARGLCATCEAGYCGADPSGVSVDEQYLKERLHDQHEIYHVLTGYGPDVRGEMAVAAFTATQTHDPGVASIPLYMLYKAGHHSEVGRVILEGFRRGLRARWLVDAPWEDMLARPLAEIREEWGIGEPTEYRPLAPTGRPLEAAERSSAPAHAAQKTTPESG